MDGPKNPAAPKKSSFKLKLLLYLFALMGLVWFGFQAYWEYFKFKLWLAGFGTGAFWAAGMVAGFVYFYAAHKIYERIKAMPSNAEKIGSYIVFALALLVLNPLILSLASILFTPPGSLNTASLWFFYGCAIGSGIVLFLERLFTKKSPKIEK